MIDFPKAPTPNETSPDVSVRPLEVARSEPVIDQDSTPSPIDLRPHDRSREAAELVELLFGPPPVEHLSVEEPDDVPVPRAPRPSLFVAARPPDAESMPGLAVSLSQSLARTTRPEPEPVSIRLPSDSLNEPATVDFIAADTAPNRGLLRRVLGASAILLVVAAIVVGAVTVLVGDDAEVSAGDNPTTDQPAEPRSELDAASMQAEPRAPGETASESAMAKPAPTAASSASSAAGGAPSTPVPTTAAAAQPRTEPAARPRSNGPASTQSSTETTSQSTTSTTTQPSTSVMSTVAVPPSMDLPPRDFVPDVPGAEPDAVDPTEPATSAPTTPVSSEPVSSEPVSSEPAPAPADTAASAEGAGPPVSDGAISQD